MSQPAQRPPKTFVANLGNAMTELLMLAAAFFGGLVIVALLMLVGVLPDAKQAAWSGIIAGPILIGTAAACYLGMERMMIRRGEPSPPLVPRGLRKPAVASVGIALAGVLMAILGSAVLGGLQKLIFDAEVEEQQAIVDLVEHGSPFELITLAIAAVLLAPIAEELLFRHMFFRRLQHRAGAELAWILPALAFALSHWNPIGLVIYVWLGLVFAWVYLSTGRLWVAMLVHAGHNAFALSALLWLPPEFGG